MGGEGLHLLFPRQLMIESEAWRFIGGAEEVEVEPRCPCYAGRSGSGTLNPLWVHRSGTRGTRVVLVFRPLVWRPRH